MIHIISNKYMSDFLYVKATLRSILRVPKKSFERSMKNILINSKIYSIKWL